MNRRFVLAGAAAACGLLLALPVQAQPELFPTFAADLGGYLITSNTSGTLAAGSGDLGQEVDFEDDFGIADDRSVAAVRLEWQPLEHHMFRLAWFELARDGSRTLARDIDWGGVVYPASATVTAELTNTVWEVDWTWWLYRRERGAFGLELGATLLDLSIEASARVQVGQSFEERRREASTTAPVPTIGIAGRGQLGDRFHVNGVARFLPGVSIDNIDGDALVLSASGDWMFTDNFGLGINWSSFSIDAEIDDSNYHGTLDLTYSGVQIYARLAL